MSDTSWKELLLEDKEDWETFKDSIEYVDPPDLDFDRKFDGSWGTANRIPFILWTKTGVYYSAEYDGQDYIEAAPRNPPQKEKDDKEMDSKSD